MVPRGARRCTAAAAALLLLLLGPGCAEPRHSDYRAELQGWDQQITATRGALQRAPGDVRLNARLVYLGYSRAVLTGEPHDFIALREQLLYLQPSVGELPQMQLLSVKLDYHLHRFAAARARLASLPPAPEDSEWRALDADLALQEGRYSDAQALYAHLLQSPAQVRWDQLARYAHLQVLLGNATRARQLYARARELLTAKQLRHYAWLEVQLGALEMREGRPSAALQHYRQADRAYSGYWLVADHIAEATAAQGDVPAAIQQYQRIVQQWPRPDFQRSLGDLYSLDGDDERARQCYALAEAEYGASVARGEVHYLHHLADFHADVTRDGAAAVKFARQDLQLRQNYAARDTLAWALYRNGQFEESLASSNAALEGGAHDVHVLRHAALIHAAAGQGAEGTALLQRATLINPRSDAFHVHR